MISTLLAKLVNEKWFDWDESLLIVILFYRISLKVSIRKIPFQLVYGLNPSFLIKCLLLMQIHGNAHSCHVRDLVVKLPSWKDFKRTN
jgi:hypothetical protein